MQTSGLLKQMMLKVGMKWRKVQYDFYNFFYEISLIVIFSIKLVSSDIYNVIIKGNTTDNCCSFKLSIISEMFL